MARSSTTLQRKQIVETQLGFSMKRVFRNKVIGFLVTALLLFVSWQFLYIYFINTQTDLDGLVSKNLAYSANELLHFFGYNSIVDIQFLFEEGKEVRYIILRMIDSNLPGVRIGDACNGLNLFGLFLIVIAAFPTRENKSKNLHKLWYIPLGILLIHLVNMIRVTILTVIATYNYEALNFNHDVTFKLITYTFIFFLWYIWMTKFAGFSMKKQTQ